eukprot:scaffold8817_cov158-Skeletonema_marinoi.AAC.4
MAILRSPYCLSLLNDLLSSSLESLSSDQAQEASSLDNTGAGRFCGRLIQPCPSHSIDESTVNQYPIESRAKLPHLLMNQPHH